MRPDAHVRSLLCAAFAAALPPFTAAQLHWSAPVDVTRAPQPPDYPRIHVDADGNLHAFFHAIPGLGSPQAWHTMLPFGAGTSWSQPVLLSAPGSPTWSATIELVFEDAEDRLCCVFNQALALFATEFDLRRPLAGWSTPVQISGPGTALFVERLEDRHGTSHVFFHDVPAAGFRRLFHTERRAGQAFSPATQVDTDAGGPATFAFAAVDRSDVLHVLYQQPIAPRNAQLLWRSRPLQGGALTPPVDVSRTVQPATLERALFDARDTLHVFFRAIPGATGVAQLHHAFRASGGAFAAPVLLSTPGSPSFAPGVQRLFADAHGKVHAVFQQIGDGSLVNQVWQRELDQQAPANGWSAAANVSRANQPAILHDLLVDPNGAVHATWTSVPGVGGVQLFHAARPPGAAWTLPVLVSSPGSPFQPAGARVLRYDAPSRRVQCTWLQAPGGPLVQYWLREIDVDRLAQGFTAPVNVSNTPQSVQFDRLLADARGGLHLLFDVSPPLGASRIMHAHRPAGGSFTPSVAVSEPGIAPAQLVGHGFDRVGDLDVLFEQVPSGSSVAQIWSRRFDVDRPSAGWSPATPVSRAVQPASWAGHTWDGQNTLHVFYRAIPGAGAAQLHHAARPKPSLPWTPPVLLSTPGSPGFHAGVAQFVEDRAGGMHAFFQQVEPVSGIAQTWHTTTGDHLSLFADRIAIPLPQGGAQTVRIAAGAASAGLLYYVLGSSNGSLPGLFRDELLLPLNTDDYTVFTVMKPNTWPWSGSAGVLDAAGGATATFTVPPGLPPALAGLVLHHACVVFGPSGIVHIGNAVPVRLTAR